MQGKRKETPEYFKVKDNYLWLRLKRLLLPSSAWVHGLGWDEMALVNTCIHFEQTVLKMAI